MLSPLIKWVCVLTYACNVHLQIDCGRTYNFMKFSASSFIFSKSHLIFNHRAAHKGSRLVSIPKIV